ncbi:MAG: PEGA domain-containing protein [Archangiaceae bacterium]|nr:PEGA domain-containing protein [Archangiaceae bacterium]
MLAALALLTALSAEPAKTSSVPYVAVFVSPDDATSEKLAGRAEVQLAERLQKKGALLLDLDQQFPKPKTSSAAGDQLIKEGKEAYDNLDMDAAILKLTQAAAYFLDHPEQADAHHLAEVYVFLGAAELQNGIKTAGQSFSRAAALDPGIKPDPRFFAADVQKAFTAARSELESKPRASAQVGSTPAGATVEVDGAPRGLSPLPSLELLPGRHHLRATRPGYVTAAKFPELSPSSSTELKLELTPLPAYAASVDLARRLANRNNFDAKVLPPQASQLAQQLQVRFLVLGTATTVNSTTRVNAQVWDVETGDRLREVKFDVDEFGLDGAAETITRWLQRPEALMVVEARPSAFSELVKKPWVWAVVGVVVVGGAVSAGYLATDRRHRPDFITGIP